MTVLTLSLVSLLFLSSIFSCVAGQGLSMTGLFNNENDDALTLGASAQRGLKFLVEEPQTILEYHNGPLLSDPVTPVYVIWYGVFSEHLKSTIRDFFSSFNHTVIGAPTVTSWWSLTSGYRDGSGRGVSKHWNLESELDDNAYSRGKVLNTPDVELLVLKCVNSTFPANSQALYVVMTDEDVAVEDFCFNSCASHSATSPATTPYGMMLPYAWVANSEKQCPGKCAWPFAKAPYGPRTPALVPPNANVGTDGMVINLATMMAGAATNPFDNGFYQGDGSVPLEAATACAGSFGLGSYGGYPGELRKDKISGASFNSEGVNGRKFLLPALWNAVTRVCTPP